MGKLRDLLKGIWYFPVNVVFLRAVKSVQKLSARVEPFRIDDLSVRKILVIRLDAIGDSVMMSPFLRELHGSKNPNATVTLVTNSRSQPLYEHCPYVDEVFIFDDGEPKLPIPFRRFMRAIFFARRKLTKPKFDVVFCPRWDIDYYGAGILTYFSGARHRIGFSEFVSQEKQVANNGYDNLFTQSLRSNTPHEVLRNLEFLSQAGVQCIDQRLEAWLSPKDHAEAAVFLGPDFSARRPLIALGVGGSHPNRVWSKEAFRQLSAWLTNQNEADVLIVGGPDDRHTGNYIQEESPDRILNAAGHTSLRVTAALLTKCSLFVGCDSGPKHMAASCGVPVIEISRFPHGGNPDDAQSPTRFKAWGVDTTILRPDRTMPPCQSGCISEQAHCINQIRVEDVIQAIKGFKRTGNAN